MIEKNITCSVLPSALQSYMSAINENSRAVSPPFLDLHISSSPLKLFIYDSNAKLISL